MPDRQYPDRQNNRCEFKHAEKNLVCARVSEDTLGCLRKTKYCAQVYQQTGARKGRYKCVFAYYNLAALDRPPEQAQKDEKCCERESLKCEACK